MSVGSKQALRFLVRPFVYSCLYTAAWIIIHRLLNYQIDQELPFLSPVIDCLGAILGGTYGLHALFASFSLNRISNKHDAIEHADAVGDLDEFLFNKDRRSLNLMWRMLLLAQTAILLLLFIFTPIPVRNIGLSFLGFGSFPIFLFWEVAVELDDPFKGFLKIELFHPEWLDMNPEEYFRKKSARKAA